MVYDYLLDNWALILVLLAFAISLMNTVFLDKITIRRMYILIVAIFLLSIVVFLEFKLAEMETGVQLRVILMAVRYSATPFILAQIIFTLIGSTRWIVFIPAIILAIIDFISVFTGLVFSVGEDSTFVRGPLGTLPFIVVGVYSVYLIYLLLKRSNKRPMEIIPIIFLGFAFASGLLLPFIYGKDYSRIFCTTIAVALYVYYVFLILQLAKKDPLTGLLNRQAYYSDTENNSEDITSILSIDMNGLKQINDINGHIAGDKALITLASCFADSMKLKHSGYRLGGDEFLIVCHRTDLKETIQLYDKIHKKVSESGYSCSIGYAYNEDGKKSMDELLQESDEMMYQEKKRYYDSKKK